MFKQGMRTLLGLLLLVVGWLSCFSLCREAALRNWIPADWRLRLASTTALWGALLVLVVECLSGFRSLNASALLITWLVLDFGLLLLLRISIKARNGQWLPEWLEGLRK